MIRLPEATSQLNFHVVVEFGLKVCILALL
jgi:hypothetical protein